MEKEKTFDEEYISRCTASIEEVTAFIKMIPLFKEEMRKVKNQLQQKNDMLASILEKAADKSLSQNEILDIIKGIEEKRKK